MGAEFEVSGSAQTTAGSRQWEKPVLTRLDAADAEHKRLPGQEGLHLRLRS